MQFKADNLGIFRNRYAVSFYPFETEPQINIESESRDEPYRVAYVRIEDWKTGLMNAYEARRDLPGQWEDFEVKGGNRVFQPVATQVLCPPDDICAVLVPGLAFSPKGERLGRGAGFYDRFLHRHPGALRIGVAFQEQITDSIPVDTWDEKIDIILTNQRLYQTKSYGEWQKHGKVKDRSQL